MLASGAQIGKYLLGRKLGQGGFGVVFKAHDSSLDREVALKFLTEEASVQPQVLQRFLQEARSAAKIAHPGIVTVYECGQLPEANNAAYIAMELLDGESLTDRLSRSGRLAFDAAMEIVRQVASALEAAHRAGIVHRDLKPDNVFLVRDPAVVGGERVKVLDFGIAKLGRSSAASSVQTQSMQVFGTPRYMSPEQCKSAAAVDLRSDIYTLGCILFELVCGRPPFAGAPGELIAQHVLVEAPTPRKFVPDVPYQLEALIVAMLAKEPDDRPQTMAAVQRQLESGGAMSPGAAPTLMPGAPLPPMIGYGRPPTSPASAAASPTTLGAAASSAVVRRASNGKRTVVIGALAGAVVIAIAITVGIRLSGNEPAASPPMPADQVAAAPKPAEPKPAEPPRSIVDFKPAAAVEAPKQPEVKKTATPAPPSATARAITPPKTVKKPVSASEDTAAKPGGTLSISCRPGCEVRIDGFGTFHAPIRGFKLPVGRHAVALVNAELGVDERFVVEIESGDTEVITKDYSDRVKPVKPVKPNKDRTIDPRKKLPPPPVVEPPADPKVKDKTINPFAKQPS